jgi:hypothetical protein
MLALVEHFTSWCTRGHLHGSSNMNF